MPSTNNLSLPLIEAAQAQKHVTHNEALALLDAVVQLSVKSRDLTIPPASPNEGDRYIVASNATLAWSGYDGAVAAWSNAGWVFLSPKAGWIALDETDNMLLVYSSGSWAMHQPTLHNLSGVGIGASFDATNALSVSSPASLFSHSGAGHQLKVNKAATGQVASLLYQSNWSGRAETGLAGNDDYTIKVSEDGSNFSEAVRIESSTGRSTIKAMRSGSVDIASNAVADVIPPTDGGVVIVMLAGDAQYDAQHALIAAFRIGGSPQLNVMSIGAGFEDHGVQSLTGGSSTIGASGISVAGGGLQIENRTSSAATYTYSFIC